MRALGKPFGPAGKVFREWVSVPAVDRRRCRELLREGVDFVWLAQPLAACSRA
jgi:hypothetical protein